MELEVPITQRRRQTRNLIYRHIYNAREACTKQTIARDLGLSLPTVYQNLTELIEAGLVRYCGEQQSTGGRKAQLLDINAQAGIALGVSVMEDRLRLVATDLRLRELHFRKVPYNPRTDFEDFGFFLAQAIDDFIDDYELDRDKLLGVGIAIPGLISPEGGRLILAPTLHLENISLENLTSRIPCPTYVENDATGGGHAEWFTRDSRRNMAYLSLENGVGGAVLVGGSLFTGDNRRSGEFGHMCVEPEGLLHLRKTGLSGGLCLRTPDQRRPGRHPGPVFC